MCIRAGGPSSVHKTKNAAELVERCGDARNVLAVPLYALGVRSKPESIETCMHARLTHSPHGTERVGGRHVLAGGGRAVLVTYSGFFDWTSRGPLHLMVLQAAVQWLAVR